ncbi:MAG TPA: preprotein translocase subunit SecG [Steroidobacteraceae bacterium]|nr:preprotein translocase subunit SecG [Steroidobacteraceae bacterium]
MLHSILLFIHILSAMCIVALVLVQRGKGADAGAGFGSGASGTVFGARGASTALSRATAILAGVFMVTSLTLAYMGARTVRTAPDSVLDRLAEQEASTVPTVPAQPSTVPTAPLPTAPAPGTPAPVPAAPPAQ